MRPTAFVLALAALAGASSAAAQPRDPQTVEEGAELDHYLEGEESPRLEALRLDELRLFRRQQALVEAPAVTYGLPDALGSDVPPDERVARGAPLPWLEGLNLPDLPVRFHEQVVEYLEYFKQNRRGRMLMRAWMERASRYGGMIREELVARGLPEDLRCVAMAESGFDPTVRSRRGAAGMWQFVPRTGAEYGLERSRWFDERMDPSKSTRAAAEFLGDLHRRFGSWELALAAYNMGYGALLRAIRKYNTNDYWVLAGLEAGLPFETTVYVAKIMACAVVMRNADAFDYGDLDPDTPLETESFEVPGGVRLSRLARLAGVEREELEALNPELLRGRVPPSARRWAVRIPAGQADHFARVWSRVRPQDPAHQAYVVRFGESLRDVARRFRTTPGEIERMNDMLDGETIGAGTTLLVPAVEPREDERDEAPVVAVPEGRFAYRDRVRVFYETSRGDTLAEIAAFFQVREDEIRRWNHVDADASLQDEMMLQLFVPRSVDLSQALVLREGEVRLVTVGTERFFDEHEARQGRVRFRYRVVEGDTLSSIGRRFGLSIGSIARINRFSRRSDLRVGQEIIIYADEDRVPARFRRQANEATASAAESAPAAAVIAAPTPERGASADEDEDARENAPAAEEEAEASADDSEDLAAEADADAEGEGDSDAAAEGEPEEGADAPDEAAQGETAQGETQDEAAQDGLSADATDPREEPEIAHAGC
ncbi:MAG: murein transglycosylase [Sandaracinus sp.]|nr:murein transglycosylase [Myxococcales bacterium]MAT27721.1 murein transglycosylase [Sandaracinus sp.]HJK99980.1 LysM peptidoglycan-binding domain-containing protein [Polyangiaceae bacterium LLY-WYZ-15_(1-7)]MBJ71868.1 murein transglycosylase [Sandaracinus sp.]HJL26268.1 LysM peptidoglycan-binding domain-containing protein [Polyangiaceae bacterium LLY-WYZ-15_(1-7)]